MEKSIIDVLAWVKRGKQRRAIIQVMNTPKIPTEIQQDAKEINPKITLNNCSDVLRDFVKEGIAKCLNPQSKVGRLYELTSKGRKVQKLIKK